METQVTLYVATKSLHSIWIVLGKARSFCDKPSQNYRSLFHNRLAICFLHSQLPVMRLQLPGDCIVLELQQHTLLGTNRDLQSRRLAPLTW